MWPVYAGLAAYQLISGAQQAETIRGQAELTKQVDEANAEYAELDAWNAERQGETKVARYQTKIDQTVSDQREAFASQGVDVNFGTAGQLQAETKLNGFLNQLDLKNQAHAIALGYTNQARSYRMNAVNITSQAAYNAQSVQTASVMNAVGTIIKGSEEKSLSGYARKKPTSVGGSYADSGSQS